MKRILWFRRDLRVEDNPLLSLDGEVFPIFIFDDQILNELPSDDRRVSFIFDNVIKLKKSLQSKGLDLKIFWGDPVEIIKALEIQGFDEVVASGDYDAYARERDLRVSHILHFRYMYDTYIFKPEEILKDNGTPYLVFTPFYNKAKVHFSKEHLQEYTFGDHTLYETSYEGITTCDSMDNEVLPLKINSLGFTENLPKMKDPKAKMKTFQKKLEGYVKERDYLDKEATSHLSVDLRFGTISVRSILRFLVEQKKEGVDTEPFF